MSNYSIKKHNGDDSFSWAIFEKGKSEPKIEGLTRHEASYYKNDFIKKDKKNRHSR